MAHLVKKKRYLGCLWELETVTLPGGAPTTDFQHWRISFGMQKPRSSKTKVLRGITKEAIEADRSGGYLHKRLLQACAPQNLYGQDYYYLEYRMPEAPFTVRVKIDRVDQVARAYDEFKTIPAKIQRRLMLKLIPRSLNPEDPIYDSRPAKTIKTQLKNRAAITRHLVDLYLDGKYKLKDLGKCMDLTGSELRREAYQVVPVHERPDHEYLVAKRDRSKKRTLEERYMRDEITLTEYNDMKDPDRRERRLAAEATYPLPEPLYTCVICGKDACAQIPCMECKNRACQDCMYEKFHGEVDRPYVLMHHIYCLKLGEPILHENKFAKKRAEEKKREKEEKLRLLKEAESPAPASELIVAAPRPARRRSLKAISAAAAFGGGAKTSSAGNNTLF